MKKDEYLKDRLGDQIDWYNRKSSLNQKWFKQLQVTVIISSASIPFLTGFITTETIKLKIIVGLIGLLITGITSVLGLYKFQENWLEYRTTCETLKHEKYLFLTNSEPYNLTDSFNLLVERVENLISKENTSWKNYMKKQKEK